MTNRYFDDLHEGAQYIAENHTSLRDRHDSLAAQHRSCIRFARNVVSALRRAFAFGLRIAPSSTIPAKALCSARISKKDRPAIDPFSVQDAEVLIAAIHRDWGEAQGNYDESRFLTGLRPSEQIALVVSDSIRCVFRRS